MVCDILYAKASYKGVQFEIQPVSHTIEGQIVNTQLYPFTNFHYNEPLVERTPIRFTVRGRLIGVDFRDQAERARQVWSSGGVGTFFEPTTSRNFDMVLTEPVVFDYSEQVLNSVSFTLSMVEIGLTPYPNTTTATRSQVLRNISTFNSNTSDIYTSTMSTVTANDEVFSGFNASLGYADDTARITIPGSVTDTPALTNVRSTISNTSPSTTASDNVTSITLIFEEAIKSDAPVSFYQQMTELRVDGTPTEKLQAELTASIGLGYYLEKLTQDGASDQDISEFVDRATAFKTSISSSEDSTLSTPEAIANIDSLIVAAGGLPNKVAVTCLNGTRNAIVTSYEVYGNVSKANEIIAISNGVSGALMNGACYAS